MKKLLFTLIAIIAAMTANAQIVKDLEYPRAHFGIRAAFTLNNATISEFYHGDTYSVSPGSKPFISGGLAVDFRVSPMPIYLETGLYYVNRSAGDDAWEMVSDYNVENNCIDLPLLASYHLYFTDNMSIQPFIGPYVGYSIDRETMDYGMRIGLGWNLGRLYANIGYDYGFEVDGMKTNTFFATIGLNIGGKY